MILRLEIPDSLARLMHLDGPGGPRRALEILALHAYRCVAFSEGQVGELLGLSFHETEAFLKAHNAPPGVDAEGHLRDLRNLEKMTSK